MNRRPFLPIDIAVACVFGVLQISPANAAGESLDHVTPAGVRTVITEDAGYTAITTDGATAGQVYAITSSGGIEVWGYEKEWGTGNWSSATVAVTGTFTTLTRDGVRADIVFGASSDGGIVQYEWVNRVWQANVLDEPNRVYQSLTYDSVHPNRIYAASDEGVYEFTYTDSWGARLLTEKVYKQLAANGTSEGLKFYGLDEDGHIDQIYFAGTWQTAAVDSQNSYSFITGDAVDSNKVYGMLAGGGINQISYAGNWIVRTVVAEENTYSALASYRGKAGALFAQSGVNLQILSAERDWAPKELSAGPIYRRLAVGASEVFGLAGTEEP